MGVSSSLRKCLAASRYSLISVPTASTLDGLLEDVAQGRCQHGIVAEQRQGSSCLRLIKGHHDENTLLVNSRVKHACPHAFSGNLPVALRHLSDVDGLTDPSRNLLNSGIVREADTGFRHVESSEGFARCIEASDVKDHGADELLLRYIKGRRIDATLRPDLESHVSLRCVHIENRGDGFLGGQKRELGGPRKLHGNVFRGDSDSLDRAVSTIPQYELNREPPLSRGTRRASRELIFHLKATDHLLTQQDSGRE